MQLALGTCVTIVPIEQKDRKRYEALVLRHVGARYEGIDETFATRTLEIHDLGHDPAGFFTERKEVFSVWDRKQHVGFTTITWKNNGCAKTGPTIIESQYRRHGLGRATRRAIERLVRDSGYRKIYCTCADNAHNIIAYLLDSGMKIEAHLDRQYSGDHGELVFGKFLVADEFSGMRIPKRSRTIGKLINIQVLDKQELRRSIVDLFSKNWVKIDEDTAERVLKSALSRTKPDPRRKSKRIGCVANGTKIVAAAILLPKRGGAVKALLSTVTEDAKTIKLMIEEICLMICHWGSRKIYFLHPLLDGAVVDALKESQFQMEDFLKAPYRPGEDVGIFSRFC